MSLKVIDQNQFISNPGERYKKEYAGDVKEDGTIELIEVGVTDLYELHQRDAHANDVEVLYARFCNGDITALSQRQGTFLDAVGMPRDLRGMYDTISKFETAYINMPEDYKKETTFEQFLENAGSDSWFEKLKKFKNIESTDEKTDSNNENTDS